MIIGSHNVTGLALEEKCDICIEYWRNFTIHSINSISNTIRSNIKLDPKIVCGNMIGHALIESLDVSIGGHELDCHMGDFLHLWEALTYQNK